MRCEQDDEVNRKRPRSNAVTNRVMLILNFISSSFVSYKVG